MEAKTKQFAVISSVGGGKKRKKMAANDQEKPFNR